MKELLCESTAKALTYNEGKNYIRVTYNGFYPSLRSKAEISINEHYKNIKQDVPERMIYISDKGYLTFQTTEISRWIKKSCLDKKLKEYYEEKERIKNDETLCNYRKFKKLIGNKGDLNYLFHHEDSLKRIESFRLKTERLILKSPNEIYLVTGNKIKRLNSKKFWFSHKACSLFYDFSFDLEKRKNKEAYKKIIEILCDYIPNLKYVNENIGIIEKFSIKSIIQYTCMDNFYDNPMPKFIIKLLKDKQMLFDGYYVYRKLNFKDINIAKKFCINQFESDVKEYNVDKYKKYYDMLKDYYKDKNENVDLIFYNRLKSSNMIEANKKIDNWYSKKQSGKDSIEMLIQAFNNRKKYPDKDLIPLKSDILKKKLYEIHNYLSKIIRNDSAKINYRKYNLEEFPKFEKKVKNYNFLMPRDSFELARLADVFDNCVASYSRFISKNDVVVYATDSNEMIEYVKNNVGDVEEIKKQLKIEQRYPACIEICKDDETNKYFVNQNYTFHNQNLPTKIKNITNAYFKSILTENYN